MPLLTQDQSLSGLARSHWRLERTSTPFFSPLKTHQATCYMILFLPVTCPLRYFLSPWWFCPTHLPCWYCADPRSVSSFSAPPQVSSPKGKLLASPQDTRPLTVPQPVSSGYTRILLLPWSSLPLALPHSVSPPSLPASQQQRLGPPGLRGHPRLSSLQLHGGFCLTRLHLCWWAPRFFPRDPSKLCLGSSPVGSFVVFSSSSSSRSWSTPCLRRLAPWLPSPRMCLVEKRGGGRGMWCLSRFCLV